MGLRHCLLAGLGLTASSAHLRIAAATQAQSTLPRCVFSQLALISATKAAEGSLPHAATGERQTRRARTRALRI